MVSTGGGSNTIAGMTKSIAEAYYVIPRNIREKAAAFLDDDRILKTLRKLGSAYGKGTNLEWRGTPAQQLARERRVQRSTRLPERQNVQLRRPRARGY